MGAGVGVGDEDVLEAQGLEEVVVIEPGGALSGDDFHRFGGEVETHPAVLIDGAGLIGVDAVEDNVLEMGIAHSAKFAVAGEPAGVHEALPEGGNVRVGPGVVGKYLGNLPLQVDPALVHELAEEQCGDGLRDGEHLAAMIAIDGVPRFILAEGLVGHDDAASRDEGHERLADVRGPGAAGRVDSGLRVGGHAGVGRGTVAQGGGCVVTAAARRLEGARSRREVHEFQLEGEVVIRVERRRGIDRPGAVAERFGLGEPGHEDGRGLAVEEASGHRVPEDADQFLLVLAPDCLGDRARTMGPRRRRIRWRVEQEVLGPRIERHGAAQGRAIGRGSLDARGPAAGRIWRL